MKKEKFNPEKELKKSQAEIKRLRSQKPPTKELQDLTQKEGSKETLSKVFNLK